jgi:hypothetical protein
MKIWKEKKGFLRPCLKNQFSEEFSFEELIHNLSESPNMKEDSNFSPNLNWNYKKFSIHMFFII